MTDVVLDPHRCPDCRAALTGGRTCPGCGLLVTGPVAARLWDVTVQLVRLRGERERLLTLLRPGGAATAPEAAGERAVPPQLATRAAAAPAAPAAATPAADPDAAWAAAFGETAPAWTAERRETAAPAHRAPAARWAQPRPRREWTPQRVQNLLLAVGALLLVTAAIAFTALAWGRLPIAARGAVMLAVTALSGYAADRVLRRGLTASAEAIALLTVLFGVVDAYAARRANLGGLAGTDGATYWSVASGVLAAGAAGFARLVPTRSVRWASLAGAQLPLAITALRVPDWTFAERGAVLVAQAAGLVYAARWLRGTAVAARACGLANYTAGVSLALATAYFSSSPGDVRVAALVLAAAAAAAQLWPGERMVPVGVTTLALVLAAFAPARLSLTPVQEPAAAVAIGLLALVALATLPRAWRAGGVAVASGAVGLAVATVAAYAVEAVALPFGWLAEPWTRHGDAVRAVLSPHVRWHGSVVALGVVAAAAVAAVVAAEAMERRDLALWPALALGSVAVLMVPLGLAWSYRGALAWDLAAGLAGLAATVVLRRWVVAVPASAVLAVTLALALADRTPTLVVLAVVTLAYAGLAVAYEPVRDAVAGVAAAGTAAFAVGVAAYRGAPMDRTGFVLAAAAFGLAGAAHLLPRGPRYAVEGVAVAAYLTALGLAATGLGWLAWSLGGGALTAAATAVRPDRRRVAGVAAALAAACAAATSAAYGAPAARTGFVLAATGCALVAAGVALRLEDVALVGGAAFAVAVVPALDDLGWLSWTLGTGAVTAAGAAWRHRVLAPVAAALGAACAGTTAVAFGNPLDRTGFVLAVVAALAVGAGTLLRGDEGEQVEAVAVLTYLLALAFAGSDHGWLFWTLALGGCVAHATAVRADRRAAHWVGLVLLTAATWDRLWIEGVRVPEAYAAPVAAIMLAIGWLRRRHDPDTGSWAAYGGGLAAAFGTTTWLVLADPGLTRPVGLALGGLAVLLLGVRGRLQAPLTVGAAVLAVDALVQVAPVAAALPRWATLGAAGLLVFAVGVTYEDRRRDVARLRETYDSLV